MLRKRILAAVTTLALALGMSVGGAGTAFADHNPGHTNNQQNPNHPEYWKKLYPNSIECYKYDPPGTSNAHGSLKDGGVVLNSYGANWPGDRWEVLIVKGGSEGDNGNGDAIYPLPVAGQVYLPPLNNGGNVAAVSHWIVCKGSTPVPAAGWDVNCVDATLKPGRALTNGDHINMDIVLNGERRQVNAQVDIRQSHDPASESGLVVRVNAPGGPYVLPLTNAQKSSGVLTFTYSTYLTGQWVVEWVQFNNMYFNQDRNAAKFFTCGTPLAKEASADVRVPGADCENGVDWNQVELTTNGATFGEPTFDGRSYSITATASEGFLFPGGLTQKTFTGTLPDRDPAACELVTASIVITPADCLTGELLDVENFDFDSTKVDVDVVVNEDGSFVVTFTAKDGFRFADDKTVLVESGTLAGPDASKCTVIDADIRVILADCLNGSALDVDNFVFDPDQATVSISTNETTGVQTVTFTAKPGFLFAGEKTTKTFEFTPSGPNLDDCGLATAAIAFTPADCFTGSALNENGFQFDPERATYEITTAESGVQTVTFTAKPGFLFEGKKETVSFEFTPTGPDFRDCATAAGTVVVPPATCDLGQRWDDRIITVDNATYEITRTPTLWNGFRYTVVFTADAGAKFLVDGEYVNTITVKGQLDVLPNRQLCEEVTAVIDIIPPTCDTGAILNVDGFASTPEGSATFTVISDGTGPLGIYMVMATANSGFTFASGLPVEVFVGTLAGPDQSLCIDPEFGAAIGIDPQCEVDVPWIYVSFEVTDPDGQLTPGQARIEFRELNLLLNENTVVIDLERKVGDEWVPVPSNVVSEAGEYQGRALWPGAAIDGDGNPTAWPGWDFNAVDGWFPTDYEVNAAWTRSVGVEGADPIEVRIAINPSAVIENPEFTYPPATEDCSTDPIEVTPVITVDYNCETFGTITLSDVEGVIYSIDGEQVEPGTYSGFGLTATPRVTAVTDPERPALFFEPGSITDLTVEFSEPEFPCDLTTLPLVEPNVTTTQASCDASGSYTLSNTEGVQWVVGGQTVNPGTYTAAPGSTVSVEAVALDGFGFGFETQTEWELQFAAAPTNCTDLDLPTLALTGASGMLGTVGILALLITLTGIGVVATRRRVEV